MPRTTRPRHNTGFSLLELLIVLVLLTIMTGVVTTALWVGFRAKRSTEAALDPVRQAMLALALIEADLRGIVRPGGALGAELVGTNQPLGADLDADRLIYYTTAPLTPTQGDPVGGMQRVELALDVPAGAAPDAPLLLLRRVTTNLLGLTTPDPAEQVISRAVASLSFRYYDGSAWQEQWDSNEQETPLPAAIEVTLRLHAAVDAPSELTQGPLFTRVVQLPAYTAGTSEQGGVIRRTN